MDRVVSRVTGRVAGRVVRVGALLAEATAYFSGHRPLHWIDFVRNRALWAGVDVGSVANVPGLSGTLDLSASGHLIDGADNQLTITSPGFDAPFTAFIEFERVTDTGAVEYLLQPYASVNDRTAMFLSASDIASLIPLAGGAASANITVGSAIATGTVNKMAARVATDSFNVALNGTAGTADTSGAAPATPTSLQIGHSSTAATFSGYIRGVAIFTDAPIEAITV